MVKDSSVLRLIGDYWIIENLKLGISSQSITMMTANKNIIRNVESFSLCSQ